MCYLVFGTKAAEVNLRVKASCAKLIIRVNLYCQGKQCLEQADAVDMRRSDADRGCTCQNGRGVCRRQAPSFTPRNGEHWKLRAPATTVHCPFGLWKFKLHQPRQEQPHSGQFPPQHSQTTCGSLRFLPFYSWQLVLFRLRLHGVSTTPAFPSTARRVSVRRTRRRELQPPRQLLRPSPWANC